MNTPAQTLKNLLPTYICDKLDPYSPKGELRCGECKACKITAALDALLSRDRGEGTADGYDAESREAFDVWFRKFKKLPPDTHTFPLDDAFDPYRAWVNAVRWERARAALGGRIVETGRGWQSMDSAPRDGTEILGLWEVAGKNHIVHCKWWFDGFQVCNDGDAGCVNPVLWMPLPATPNEVVK